MGERPRCGAIRTKQRHTAEGRALKLEGQHTPCIADVHDVSVELGKKDRVQGHGPTVVQQPITLVDGQVEMTTLAERRNGDNRLVLQQRKLSVDVAQRAVEDATGDAHEKLAQCATDLDTSDQRGNALIATLVDEQDRAQARACK